MRKIRRNSAAHFLNVLTNDLAFASSLRQLQGEGRSGVREIRIRSISTPQGIYLFNSLVPQLRVLPAGTILYCGSIDFRLGFTTY